MNEHQSMKLLILMLFKIKFNYDLILVSMVSILWVNWGKEILSYKYNLEWEIKDVDVTGYMTPFSANRRGQITTLTLKCSQYLKPGKQNCHWIITSFLIFIVYLWFCFGSLSIFYLLHSTKNLIYLKMLNFTMQWSWQENMLYYRK